jgi:prepilin-type N-terminal cleavage/methylation domain-containing protein
MKSHRPHISGSVPRSRGFSLLELVVAMAVFLLVSAAALVLFSRQQTNANSQPGLAGLNVGIRNATAQLQLDLANAGSGNYSGYNVPTWPIGVTIVNNVPTSSCYNSTTNSYGTNCFDQLNILVAANAASYPPINATDSTGGTSETTNCSYTNQGVAYGQAAIVNGTVQSLTTTASYYNAGDQLLFLNSTGTQITTGVLTQAPTVYNSKAVKFTFNPTNSDGSNNLANDPLDITACGGTTCPTALDPPASPLPVLATYLGDQYCGSDWIIKLAPITYQVNASNANDPQLTRTKGGTTTVVMDQVIGFKIGAALWNCITDTVTPQYYYDASKYDVNNNSPPPYDAAYLFAFVRSLRVSLIARTTPSSDPSFTFTNAFDGGRYLVQGASVVVNPRNLSMRD